MGHYNFKTTDETAVKVLSEAKNKTNEIVEGLKLREKLKNGELGQSQPIETPKMKIEVVYK